MSLTKVTATDALSRLNEFDTIIDARSEGEFTEDRLPGAVNWPSLHDGERVLVGTIYKQESAFRAKKLGAALVFRNISAHVEREVVEKPKDWKPLIYCWRGGSRSGALGSVLDQIGFRVAMVDGGYRAYRTAVREQLEVLPARLDLRVVCGPTGSGKSRLLTALSAEGAQVLDLEALANHRGSVLGLVPGTEQPTQKQFDSRVWLAMREADTRRPVYIESESKKIGNLRVPEELVLRMRSASCVWLELELDARVRLLLEDYDYFVKDTVSFCTLLDALRALRGNETVDAWQASAKAGNTAGAFRSLLVTHYDPLYRQSLDRNYADLAEGAPRICWDGTERSLAAAARTMIAGESPPPKETPEPVGR